MSRLTDKDITRLLDECAENRRKNPKEKEYEEDTFIFQDEYSEEEVEKIKQDLYATIDFKDRLISKYQDLLIKWEPHIQQIYENAFIRKGKFWEVWYKTKKLAPIRDTHGAWFISRILSKADTEIHAGDLYQTLKPLGTYNNKLMDQLSKTTKAEWEQMGLYSSNMKLGGLTEKAKTDLRNKMRDLEETINSEDYEIPPTEKKKAEDEYNKIEKTLKTYGVRALSRKAPLIDTATKSAYTTVSKSIKLAYAEINKHSPELVLHLGKYIRMGGNFVYTDRTTFWIIL
jgi:hypothetical protein